ncbi:hypothetical protein B9N43_12075 [Denitratisoma sp. DHT3]|uniref:PsiF family protein n=1 Tax=Denitratisoma sp. DHT3 TaxID=1981880 RepID=UPI001198B125|nr:PsiF family protein [Denitratisoma sp. DHT3]QDX81924.1 hypothetical protein B9N43_12075 [Denitratisoma sp. DHT3]
MKKLIVLACTALLCLSAQAASEAQKAQQEKMKTCNAEAKTKALKGDARKSFMKDCLSSGGSASTKEEPKAANANCEKMAEEKKLAGAAKGSFIKKCGKKD